MRIGLSLVSPQLPERLSTGAIVEQLHLDNESGRIRFKTVQGRGPTGGWVSTKLSHKELLVKHDFQKPPLTQKKVPPTNSDWMNVLGGGTGSDSITCHPRTRVFNMDKDPDPAVDSAGGGRGTDAVGSTFAAARSAADTTLRQPNSPLTCILHPLCVRPPGHRGSCVDGNLKELVPLPQPAKPGVYLSHGSKGENIDWEIDLKEDGTISFACTPKGSFFSGGMPPWRCEGDWAEADGEKRGRYLKAAVTKADLRGPKDGARILLQIAMDGAGLTWDDHDCRLKGYATLPKAAGRRPAVVVMDLEPEAPEETPSVRPASAAGETASRKEPPTVNAEPESWRRPPGLFEELADLPDFVVAEEPCAAAPAAEGSGSVAPAEAPAAAPAEAPAAEPPAEELPAEAPVKDDGNSVLKLAVAVAEATQAEARSTAAEMDEREAAKRAKEAEKTALEAEERAKEAKRLAEEAAQKAADAKEELRRAQEATEQATEEAVKKRTTANQLAKESASALEALQKAFGSVRG